MSKRILWILASLALLMGSAMPAYATGTWAQKMDQCRAHLKNEGIGTVPAMNICEGTIKPTEAVDVTLNSIDSASFDIAKRVRKFVYGGAYPVAFNGSTPTLFGAAVLFLFVWYGFQITFAGTDDGKGTTMLVTTILKAILFGALLMWFMYSYIPVMKQVDAGINWLSSLFLNQGSPPNAQSGLAAYITYGTQSFVGITVQFFHLKPNIPASASWHNIGAYFQWLQSMVLWFIPLVLLIIEMILFVGLGILAQVLFAIAVAFGPLMLVMSLIPFARKLAQSWGNFVLSAGFYKLVLAAIVALGGSVFIQSIKLLTSLQTTLNHKGVTGSIENVVGTDLYQVLIFAAVCLLLFALILAMFSASRIANHLITGFGTFDIGTRGVSGGGNIGGGGGGTNTNTNTNNQGNGERGTSATSEANTEGQATTETEDESRTKAGGDGERDTQPVVPVEDDEAADTDGGGNGEGQAQAEDSPDSAVEPGIGAPGSESGGGSASGGSVGAPGGGGQSEPSYVSTAGGGDDVQAPVDGGGSNQPGGGMGGASNQPGGGSPGGEPGGGSPAGGTGSAPSSQGVGGPGGSGSAPNPSDDEGFPTSREEPPLPRDDEIPPESDDDDKGPIL